MRTVLQTLLAAAIAMIPSITIHFENWSIIYGSMVLAIGMASAMLPSPRFSVDTAQTLLLPLVVLITPIVVSTLANQPEDAHVENIAVIMLYVALGIALLDARTPESYTRFCWLVAFFHVLVVPLLWWEMALADLSDFEAVLDERRAFFNFDEFEMHPNLIGSLGIVIALAAVGQPVAAVRVALIVYALFVAWLMSSRGALLSIGIAGLTYAVLWAMELRSRNPSNTYKVALILLAGSLVAAVFAYRTSDFLLKEVILIDDQYRGIDTGFSDRATLWQAAYDLWAENPFVGVGYGQHAEQMGLGTYAHNMVLVLLSELGIFGLIGFVLFSGICLRNGFQLLRLGYRGPAYFIITTIAAYWGYGLFEGKALSAGNPVSAIFFLVCFSSFGYHASGRGAEPEAAGLKDRFGLIRSKMQDKQS